jgi:twitching motility protein PilT
MAKLDGYLRSLEKFGAAGAVLTSGQAVTLRFPTGDRQATQVTPHDQLVAMVREVATPTALDQIDKGRVARFDLESAGTRYTIDVAPRPNAWQVQIAPATQAPPTPHVTTRIPTPLPFAAPEMTIERGQYDRAIETASAIGGSVFLDPLTRAARGARASDVFLAADSPPLQRVGGEVGPAGGFALDAETLSRELGVIAPADARTAWTETGNALFAYGDGIGRVRVALGRDHRGPCAALRLLPAEPPNIDQLDIPAPVEGWLTGRGLIIIAGPTGAGKTVTLAALVRAVGEMRRRVIAIEDPIELVHVSASISQRAVGSHVASIAAGVRGAMHEGADAIAIENAGGSEAAAAVVEAVAGGHLVLVSVVAPTAALGLDRILDAIPVDRRDHARKLLGDALLGAIRPVAARTGARSFEVAGR